MERDCVGCGKSLRKTYSRFCKACAIKRAKCYSDDWKRRARLLEIEREEALLEMSASDLLSLVEERIERGEL